MMMTESPAAGRERLAQLRVVQRQLRRLPLMYAVADLLIVWMLVRHDLVVGALCWVAVTLLLQWARWWFVGRPSPEDASEAEERLDHYRWLAPMMGLARTLPVALLFSQEALLEQVVLTILYLGNASAAVSLSAGRWRQFAAWALPALGSLALAWLWLGGVEATLVALCVVMLGCFLSSHVHEHGLAVAAMAALVHENDELVRSLRAERDRVAEASQAQSRFFAATGHDLRQPLHALQANAVALQLLTAHCGDARLGDIAQAVRRSTDHAQALLDGVLDLARLRVGALQPVWGEVDLPALARDACADVQALAVARGLSLRVEVADEGVPRLRSDEAMLKRILHNLLGNALAYTHAGGIVVSVRPGGPQAIELGVLDTGAGISAAEQARIFEAFVRGSAGAEREQRGLGLGLSIVHGMADLLGARVALASQPGQGTQVRLTLPLQPPREAAQAGGTEPAAPASWAAAAAPTAKAVSGAQEIAPGPGDAGGPGAGGQGAGPDPARETGPS